jgi:CRISPR/Cas system CSM-associated protein Csm4 (group 5 of RAMP superfamily)
MFDFIKTLFSSNDLSTRCNISEKPKPTVTPVTYYSDLMLKYKNLIKEQPLISREEYDTLIDNVQKTEKKITNQIEVAKIIKYLTIVQEKEEKEIEEKYSKFKKDMEIYDTYGFYYQPRIFFHTVYFPLCWDRNYKMMYNDNNKVCWYCGDRHE